MRRDVTNCPRIHAEYRGVNVKEWILVDGREALFKETQIKQNTNESTYADYSEAIVTDICNLLNVPCQEVEFAIRNGRKGCICYSFLDRNNDELRDMGTVIQGVRPDFNSKSMLVPSTKESYGIEMILEAIDAFSRNRKEAANSRKLLIEQVLADSLIDHYDRNPSNLSMLLNPEKIELSPKYDNGTSLSMSVPKEALDQYLEAEGDYRQKHAALRKDVYSKIGYLGMKYVSYEDLETYIFNYYPEESKDIVERIRTNITEENIDRMLADERYSNLSDTNKAVVKMKLLSNRDEMIERSQKISRKNQIDSILFNRKASNNFTSNVEKGTIAEVIPEYENCIGKQVDDVDYEGTMDELIPEKIQNVVDIQQLSRFFKIPITNLTKREKNLLKWVTIMESIQQSNPKSNPVETITSRLGFVKEDAELIRKLIQDKFKDEKDHIEARELIYGKTGIGAENINLYIAKKFVDASVMRREIRDQRMDELRTYAETMRETKELQDIISNKPNIFKNRNFQNAGLRDQDQIVQAQLEVAKLVKKNPRMTATEAGTYIQAISNDILGNKQEEVSPGVFINKDEAEIIRSHIIELEDGKKIAIFNNPDKMQKVAFKMGIDYYGQIINHPSGNGVTAYFLSKKGVNFPKEFEKFAEKFNTDHVAEFGEKSIVYKPDTTGKSVSCFYVSSIGNKDARIPDVNEEQFKEQVLKMFKAKKQDKSKETVENEIVEH